MDGHEFDGFALIDWDRSACLCDVGSAGYVVAWSVTPDGDDVAWLIDLDALLDDENAAHGNAVQPHEWAGPLPERWRHRVALAPFRCGRRTKTTGRPCRIEVSASGRSCGLHSEGRVVS